MFFVIAEYMIESAMLAATPTFPLPKGKMARGSDEAPRDKGEGAAGAARLQIPRENLRRSV
jgi:hypothetical protein